MNAKTRRQLLWKNEHHRILFWILHAFEKNKDNKQRKKHSFRKFFFWNQSDYFKFDDSIKNSRKFSMIVIKVFFWKEINFDQSSINLFRKNKKRTKSINKNENSKTIKDFRLNLNELKIFNSMKKLSKMNIAMIETLTFNMMNKRKNVNLFSITLKNVKKHFEKHNKLNTMIKNVFSFEYHKFLDVFDKKHSIRSLRIDFTIIRSFRKKTLYRVTFLCIRCSKKNRKSSKNISKTI
jgi:hypothetical protein